MNIIWNDAPEPWQIGFQDSGSKTMDGINELYDEIQFYLILILVLIGWMLPLAIIRRNKALVQGAKYMNHGTTIEILWTITPALILIAIAFPSFRLLYLMDEVVDPSITVKVIGHQWYWSAEYSDYGEEVSFDIYPRLETSLDEGNLRLLEVDNRIVLPVDESIRFIVSSSDVIHSFAVPSLGLKMDALPGRLNQTSVFIEREGVYYGQCSELCGVWHGFMPIAIEAVSLLKYLEWVESQ